MKIANSFIALALSCSVCSAQTAPTIGTTSFSGASSVTLVSNATPPATATNILGTGWDATAYATTASVTITARVGSSSAPGPTGASDRYIQPQRVGTAGVYPETRVKSNDGSEFKLNSIFIAHASSVTTQNATLTGYRDGGAVSGATLTQTLTGNHTWSLFTTSGITAFENIDEMRITVTSNGGSQLGVIAFDEINIGTPVALALTGLTASAMPKGQQARIHFQPLGTEDPGTRYSSSALPTAATFLQLSRCPLPTRGLIATSTPSL